MRRAFIASVVALSSLVVPAQAASPSPPTRAARPQATTVVRSDVTYVDTTRGTPATTNTPALSTRTLRVMILRPDAPGKFPLVIFVHGASGNGPMYESFLRPFAAAGFVVAAPTEPLTSGATANAGGAVDYKNQPADVSFLIGKLATNRAVDVDHVAVAGHSMGAITTIGFYHSGHVDPRVDATIVVAGAQMAFDGGNYSAMPPIPLLLVHGAKDTTLSVGLGETFYGAAPRPKHFLRFTNGGHNDILAGPQSELLQRTAIAFMQRYLGGNTKAMAGVRADVQATHLATWQERT